MSRLLAAIPVVGIALVMVRLIVVPVGGVYELPWLLAVLNTVFLSGIPFLVVLLAVRAYLATGSVSLFWMGGGLLAFGALSLAAGWAIHLPTAPNPTVTLHNIGSLLGGVFQFAGVLHTGTQPDDIGGRRRRVVLTYSGVMAGVLLLVLAAYGEALPLFYTAEGPTPLRQAVLGSATAFYGASALTLAVLYRGSRSDPLYWYGLALLSITLGLVAVYFQLGVGSPLGWAGRIAQYAAGLYFLATVVAASREGAARGLSLERALGELFQDPEAQYRSLVETVMDAIVACDPQGRVLMWNSAAEHIFGIARQKAVGAPLAELVTTAEAASVLRELLAGPTPLDAADAWGRVRALTFRRRNGETFPGELTVSTRSTRLGRVATVTIRDITERRRAEEALRRNEERFRALIENSSDAIVLLDTGAFIQYASPSVGRLLGFAPQEVVGCSPLDFVPAEDHETVGEAWEQALQQPGGSVMVEHRCTHLDGRPRWFQSTLTNLCGDPAVGAVVINFRDITDRRNDEMADRFLSKATAALAESLDYETTLSRLAQLAVPQVADWCAVTVVDPGGALRRIATVHTDPERSRRALDLLHAYPPQRDTVRGVGAVVRTSQPEYYSGEAEVEPLLRAIAYDTEHLGILRSYGFRSVIIVPMIARGRSLGALSFATAESGRMLSSNDLALAEGLSQRAALAVDNALLYRQAQEAIQHREQFLSIASHELRTPMTVLRGFADSLLHLVEDQPDVDDRGRLLLDHEWARRVVSKMDRTVDRLTRLIEELLDVSRLQAGTIRISPQHMSLAALTQAIVEEYRLREGGRPAGRDIRMELSPAPAEAWRGFWDPNRLEQVLVNLLDNALRYSPTGTPVTVTLSVEVGTDASDGRPSMVHLEVRDQGIGILPDERSLIFRPYARASNAFKQHGAGLGMGLAIAKGIVEHHGGRIWVESQGPDQGSTFHVVLPSVAPIEEVLKPRPTAEVEAGD